MHQQQKHSKNILDGVTVNTQHVSLILISISPILNQVHTHFWTKHWDFWTLPPLFLSSPPPFIPGFSLHWKKTSSLISVLHFYLCLCIGLSPVGSLGMVCNFEIKFWSIFVSPVCRSVMQIWVASSSLFHAANCILLNSSLVLAKLLCHIATTTDSNSRPAVALFLVVCACRAVWVPRADLATPHLMRNCEKRI